MKNKELFLVLIAFLLLPFMVNAKEYCKVVSGNGKDIGSEIACGTEHFYIVDSNEDEIKLFAKYNLYTGTIIYREKIEKEEGDTRDDYVYCYDLAQSKGGQLKNDPFYSTSTGYCYYSKSIDENIVKQNENAKSAHQDDAMNYLYPQVGDVYMSADNPAIVFESYNGYTGPFLRPVGNYYDFSIDINYDDSSMINNGFDFSISSKLFRYKLFLEDSNYEIRNIGLLSLTDLNKIVEKTSKKSIPYEEWGEKIVEAQTESIFDWAPEFGDIKPYILKEHSWLYSTTYWNSTIFRLTEEYSQGSYFMFTTEKGKICGAGFNACVPSTKLGCGVRPVITIPNELQYLIKTEVSDGGSISVVDNSLGGETITFDVSTNKGFKLKSLFLRTDSGEEVEFNEEDLTYNDDGTVTISKNKFIMPFENVSIEAKWEAESLLVNPKTGRRIFIFLGLLLGVVFVVKNVVLIKKENV